MDPEYTDELTRGTTSRPRWFLPLLAVILLLTACGGSGGPSPDKTAVQWRHAIEKGDYETAWDLEGPNLRDRDGKAAGIAYRKKERFGQPLSPGASAVSIKAVRTDRTVENPDHPGEVWVYLQVNTKDVDRNHLEAVGLRRSDDHWRVQRSEPSVPHVGWVR